MQTKKAQAAMEFLMTYGWAILVVLVAIAALAYFGVLTPTKFLPERCTMPSGIACLDHKASASTGQIQMIFQNGMGVDIQNVVLTIPGCTASSPLNLTNGGSGTLTATACALTAGGRFNNDNVSVSYTNADTGLNHIKIGSLTTKVES